VHEQSYLAHALRIYRKLPEDLRQWPSLIESHLSRVPPEMHESVKQWLREMYQRSVCQRRTLAQNRTDHGSAT